MRQGVLKLLRSDRGASAAEFALVLPLLLVLLLGTIDAGRFMWDVNRAEKATQIGARMAAVTAPMSTGLIDADFASADVQAGDLIPANLLGSVTCTSTACTCGEGACPISDTTVASGAFTTVLTRMQEIYPEITAANLQVTYRGSGFGFAGSPVATGGGPGGAVETMEISPLITVELVDMNFNPVTCLMFACSIGMPTATTTLTAEDASGTFSN